MTTSPKKTSRAANKRARAKRRDEIMARWNRRVAKRLFDRATAADEGCRPAVVTDHVLHYGQWCDHRTLLADTFTEAGLFGLVLHLVRLVELKEMPYDEYLKTEEWRSVAERAKERYEGTCALDERHKAADAHHRTYARRGREYASDVVPLCRDCHQRFHDRAA